MTTPTAYFLALWTTEEITSYRLQDCSGQNPDIIIEDQTGQVSSLAQVGPTVTPGSPTVTITGNPDIPISCYYVFHSNLVPTVIIDPSNGVSHFKDCAACTPTLPPPVLPAVECWTLIACETSTGVTCDTICHHTGFDFSLFQNQWIFINGDTTCAYMPVRTLQAIYCSIDQTPALTGAFVDITYTVTSLVHNSTQYITGAPTSYTMTPFAGGNYDPLICTALTCASVAPLSGENSYSNLSTYLNTQFSLVPLPACLEAFPNDPANVLGNPLFNGAESFRIQYVEGDTFSIVIERVQGASTEYVTLKVEPGDVPQYFIGILQIKRCAVIYDTLCGNSTANPLVNPDIALLTADCLPKLPCLLAATFTSSDVTVNGGSNGSIDVTVTNIIGPLTYAWTGPGAFTATTEDLIGLLPGAYNLVITDVGAGLDVNGNPCVVILQVLIFEPPPAPPDLACDPEDMCPRLGEPGFSTKNCDPKEVIKIKSQFADSVYALFKRIRFGIETCCEFDLDKIDTKHQLLELGEILDPDLCVLVCNRYLITGTPGFLSEVQYVDCFGATINFTLDPDLEYLKCAQPDTIISLDNPITVTYVEECCDAEPVYPMLKYCVTLLGTDTTVIITWVNYKGVTLTKTLTNVVDSCGETGISSLCVCAIEKSVSGSNPAAIVITQIGTC